MKYTALAALLLATTACTDPPVPCLDPGQPARVIAIEPENDVVTVKLTTDNKSVRVCATTARDVTLLKRGDVITGHTGHADVHWPHYRWYRVG